MLDAIGYHLGLLAIQLERGCSILGLIRFGGFDKSIYNTLFLDMSIFGSMHFPDFRIFSFSALLSTFLGHEFMNILTSWSLHRSFVSAPVLFHKQSLPHWTSHGFESFLQRLLLGAYFGLCIVDMAWHEIGAWHRNRNGG